MRILLAAKHAPEGPRSIGGVQTWCRTVARELRRRGHDAVTWGPGQPVPLGGFDYGIISNVGDTKRAINWCRKVLYISHGIIPAEKPSAGALTAFTSEEVRDRWNEAGPIIRQPIDLDFFSPQDVHRTWLTRFSYRNGLPFVPILAKVLNAQYKHLNSEPPDRVRRVLRESVCVLATGRAALEAMACGVPVVLVDHRSAYQGALMDLDTEGAMARNYSGRGGIVPNISNLSQAIQVAMAMGSLRAHVERHHNVVNITDQLLEYA